jgi:hypothetical protein
MSLSRPQNLDQLGKLTLALQYVSFIRIGLSIVCHQDTPNKDIQEYHEAALSADFQGYLLLIICLKFTFDAVIRGVLNHFQLHLNQASPITTVFIIAVIVVYIIVTTFV